MSDLSADISPKYRISVGTDTTKKSVKWPIFWRNIENFLYFDEISKISYILTKYRTYMAHARGWNNRQKINSI